MVLRKTPTPLPVGVKPMPLPAPPPKASRLNLSLPLSIALALDELVTLLPAVDNKSAAARLAIVETRDRYRMVKTQQAGWGNVMCTCGHEYDEHNDTGCLVNLSIDHDILHVCACLEFKAVAYGKQT